MLLYACVFVLLINNILINIAIKNVNNALTTLQIVASANLPPPGGELSFLPIEKLISVDDVMKHRNSASGSAT